MAGANSNSQRVAAGALYKFYCLVGVSVGSILGSNLNSVFHAGQLAQLCFNYNTALVSIFNNTTGDFDVFFEGMLATVNHNGGEATIHAGLANFKIFAMVQVQADGQTSVLYSSLNQLHQVNVVGIFTSASANLQNQRRFFGLGSSHDTLDDFHVINVEGTNCIVTFVSFFEHFGRSY